MTTTEKNGKDNMTTTEKNGKDKNKTAPATSPATRAVAPAQALRPASSSTDDKDMVDFQGPYGGSVDGWWSPPEEPGDYTIKGILCNFIDKNRSDKLQSDSIILELLEDTPHVKNGGSSKIPGEKGDEKLHTAPKGCLIGVPVWKQLEGLWPRKAGHKAYITRSGEARSIGKGRSMYDIKCRTSEQPVRHVEVFEMPAEAPMAPEQEFQAE